MKFKQKKPVESEAEKTLAATTETKNRETVASQKMFSRQLRARSSGGMFFRSDSEKLG